MHIKILKVNYSITPDCKGFYKINLSLRFQKNINTDQFKNENNMNNFTKHFNEGKSNTSCFHTEIILPVFTWEKNLLPYKNILPFCILMLCSITVSAQQKSISGTVKNTDDGSSIPNATV